MTYKGVVFRFGAKGFGFIQMDDTQKQIYFHITDVVGRLILQAGNQVEFQIQKTDKGDRAILVTLISSPDRLDRKTVRS